VTVALCISAGCYVFLSKERQPKGVERSGLVTRVAVPRQLWLEPSPCTPSFNQHALQTHTCINLLCMNTVIRVMVCNTRTSQKENTSLDIAGGDKGIAAHAVAVRNAAASENYYSPI